VRVTRLPILTFVVATISGGAGAAETVLSGGPARVSLVELYTSEGCSSCPPAEAWLGDLRDDPGLWRDFVPVAFHVNYWDHLGWRDDLASPAFTARQRAYAAAWGSSTVYTPGFVRDGAEWRPGRNPIVAADSHPPGVLTLRWDPGTHTCRVRFVPGADGRGGSANAGDVTVALLGGGMVRRISRGENAGRELRHEFVALRCESARLVREPAGDAWSATLALPPRPDIPVARQALAGWVTRPGDPTPRQAAGGWLEQVRAAAIAPPPDHQVRR
jgi:hypothetical protein